MSAPRRSAPYDALLLVSFGGPERPEDVLPFLENVTRGRGIPRERLAEVGRALLRLRRPQPDQRPVPRLPRGGRGGPRRARASTCRSTGATATGSRTSPTRSPRWRADGVRRAAVLRDQRLLVVLRLPAVPREPLRRASSGRRSRRRLDKLRHYFDHPGFVAAIADATLAALAELARAQREPRPGWSSSPTRSRPRWPTASGPDGGAYVAQHRERSPGWSPTRSRRRPGVDRPLGPGLLQPVGLARTPVARARRQRPPRARCAGDGGTGGRRGPDRLRLRPHGGRLRPRHRGRGDGRAARPGHSPGRDRRACIRRFVGGRPRPAARASGSASAASRSTRAAVGGPGASVGRLRRDLLPQPARPRGRRCARHPVAVDVIGLVTPITARAARPGRRRSRTKAGRAGRRRVGAGSSRSPRPSRSPTDVVTAIDVASEELIRARDPGARARTTGSSARRAATSRAPVAASPGSSTPSTAPSTTSTASRSSRSRSPPERGRTRCSPASCTTRSRARRSPPSSGGGAFLDGEPITVSGVRPSVARRWSAPASPTAPTSASTRPSSWRGCCPGRPRHPADRLRRARPLLRRVRPARRVRRAWPRALGPGRGAADRRRRPAAGSAGLDGAPAGELIVVAAAATALFAELRRRPCSTAGLRATGRCPILARYLTPTAVESRDRRPRLGTAWRDAPL